MASCKERWRNIRAAFARSINIYKTHSGPNRVKPYYLHKELSFLVKPMMEGRDKNDDSQEISEGCNKEEYTEGEDEEEEPEHEDEEHLQTGGEEEDDLPDDTADIKSAFEALNPDISIHTESKYQKMIRKNQSINSNDYDASSGIFEPQTEFSTSDAEQDFHDTRFDDTMSQTTEADRRVTQMLNNNGLPTKRPMHLDTETIESTKRFKLAQIPATASEADIRFLEALLPDMALMNTRQKIVFKRKIYQTLEEVFENSNDFPNICSTKETHSSTATVAAHLNSGGHSFGVTPSTTTTTTLQGGSQVKQTVLTVNSSTARNLINNIANLNETELQKVNGFLQSSLRNGNASLNNNTTNMINNNTQRMTNGSTTTVIPASSAAARLLQSTPKITITKVTCPPPASLRNMQVNKPPSPSTGTVSTTIHHNPGPVMTSNVHSTTSSTLGNHSSASVNNANNNNNNSSPWSQLLPISIKDEIEDVDID